MRPPHHNWRIIEPSGRRLAQSKSGELCDLSGQLHLPFGQTPQPTARQVSPAQWFTLGCDREQAGDLEGAEQAYRQSLLAGGPQSGVCFNLGNVLYARGEAARACERYWQAVELEPANVDAWHNLGAVLAELGDVSLAITAFERALTIEPEHYDSHFNLADCLQLDGQSREAAVHWRAYLRSDQTSAWADFARLQLETAAAF